ncbi:MAG: family 78 glycoside hydrolase catalytic domain [Candidatus Caldatribacterium sp.]|nr:family 78 glycoside hydrolase catalytic domain [Candidatus Caldatribacterium sp.]
MGAKEGTRFLYISGLRFEHYREPLGIRHNRPRLSWTVATSIPAWQQKAYQVRAYDEAHQLRYETDWIISNQSVLVPWPFAPLKSRERLLVQVRVRGEDGTISPWSECFFVEAGLLHPEDWKACFITPSWEEDTSHSQPCPFLRREFMLSKRAIRARLYATALGVYEAYLNGKVVGDHVLPPGWTSYHHLLCYQTFDVTTLLRIGPNAIGAILGDGWYRGRLGFGGGRRNIYGDRLAFLAQLEVTYEDGTVEIITTDEHWRATTGPILASDLYDGEIYDARLELKGWSEPGYDDQEWRKVRIIPFDLSRLVAPLSPPVRRVEFRSPSRIFLSPSGRTIVDFGQNLVGRVRIRVRGARGQTVVLRHAEVLENGELCTRTLRTAKATDIYTLKGDGEEVWEPRFTFHGFQYVEVNGWPGELHPEDIQAVVCHSDLERTGWFECSDTLVNRFHENVVWSMRGNFLSIPTDCPQRDERLGWTGDIGLFVPVAAFLYDVCGFLSSWLENLALEQEEKGGIVPLVVPNVLQAPPMAVAVWGDAAVIVPWTLYEYYGDKEILAQQFGSMKTWVDKVAEIVGERKLWDKGFQLGDWLDPSAPPEKPHEAHTDPYLIATAYFIHSAELLSHAARVLGLEKEAVRYQALAKEVRKAFLREYVTPSGRLVSDSQTAYALAIHFGLLEEPEKERRAAQRLLELIRVKQYRIGTGFVGTPVICHALCKVGFEEAAYRLFLQKECPSWLYPVTMGATTVWERWDSLRPDGTVNPGEMTSFNHYALGAVADWLYRVVGGLVPLEPGYRRILIHPRPGGSLKWVSVRHRTPYGVLECHWTIQNGVMEIRVLIPPNTRGLVKLPGKEGNPIEVGSGEHFWSYPWKGADGAQLSIDSPIGDIAAFPHIFTTICTILKTSLPHQVFTIEALLAQGTRTLREVLCEIIDDKGKALCILEEISSQLQRAHQGVTL